MPCRSVEMVSAEYTISLTTLLSWSSQGCAIPVILKFMLFNVRPHLAKTEAGEASLVVKATTSSVPDLDDDDVQMRRGAFVGSRVA